VSDAAYDRGPMDSVALDIGRLPNLAFKRVPAAGSRDEWKPGWMQSRIIQRWRILDPRNLILLFPIRDAAPMSAAGFARVAIEAAILNYIIGYANPLVIEQHFDAGGVTR
jgi:hypothetical protein